MEKVQAYVREMTPKTSKEVMGYISTHFGLQYTISSVTALLHKLGFVYKKPKLYPGKASKEKQIEFLKELGKLEEELDPNNRVIYMDGAHPQHNSKPAYGWIEKGAEKVLKANSGRQRININGAIDSDSLDVTIEVGDSVNAQSTIKLFKKLKRSYIEAERIIIICDNARYYHSILVKEYVKNSKIELKFLPSYSPNLNLIERLWRFMNKKVRDNIYYEKFGDFKKSILDFFKNIASYQKELSSLFIKKFNIINV